MAQREVPRPRPPAPDPPPPYGLEFGTARARKSWEILVRERATEMTECWDHLSWRPLEDLPRRCAGLEGGYRRLGWRQFEVGPKQRVWYLVRGSVVTIQEVHRSHPKKTE